MNITTDLDVSNYFIEDKLKKADYFFRIYIYPINKILIIPIENVRYPFCAMVDICMLSVMKIFLSLFPKHITVETLERIDI